MKRFVLSLSFSLSLASVLVSSAARAQMPPAQAPSPAPVAQPPSATPDPGPPPAGATTRPTDAETPPAPVVPIGAPPSTVVLPTDPNASLAVRIPRLRYANTWDVNLEGGVGSVFRDHDRLAFLGRARGGILLVRDNAFWQLGATAEYLTKVGRPAFGLQAEYLNLERGVWAQLGANLDTKGRPGGMAALGFSIFGVEAQLRELDGDGDVHVTLLGKIRIPLGIIGYAIRERGGKL